METESDQVFPILPNFVTAALQVFFSFYVWGKSDDEQLAIRLVNSWATEEDQVDSVVPLLAAT